MFYHADTASSWSDEVLLSSVDFAAIIIIMKLKDCCFKVSWDFDNDGEHAIK